MLGHGLTNEERGKALKLVCIMEGSRLVKEGNMKGKKILLSAAANGISKTAVETSEALSLKLEKQEEECYLCEGTFRRMDELAADAVQKLEEYEYSSFLVGIKGNPAIEDREDELRSRFGIRWGESIRNEYSREIGKRIIASTNKNVDLKRPDILVVVDPFIGKIFLEILARTAVRLRIFRRSFLKLLSFYAAACSIP